MLLLGLAGPSSRAASAVRLASLGDAYVDVDEETGNWVIGNTFVLYGLRLDARGDLVSDGLRAACSGDLVTIGTEPDGLATVAGRTSPLGSRGSGFTVEGIDAAATSGGVVLSVRLVASARPLRATRYYLVYPDTPAVETWTTFEVTSDERVTVQDLNAYAVTLPAGRVTWIGGLDVSEADGGPFAVHSRALGPGETLSLGAHVVSTESALPYFSIATAEHRIASGLLWSGAWALDLQSRVDGLRVNLGLGTMSAWAEPGRAVEGPHAFIAVAGPADADEAAAVSRVVMAGRAGRAYPSLTTYNTWFVRGIRIDDGTIRHDMEAAASLGVELFQLDAGWYPGGDAVWDFTAGLGTWVVDPVRFPAGLAPLGELARGLGMRFGVWVEPERVALTTVEQPGLATRDMLATDEGAYAPGTPNGEARDAQICLANPEARQWVLDELVRFLDEVHPDYLKWDFNRWITCTRGDHGHPADGGNYAHVMGLYQVLAALRARYPDMLIENCSGGGHRLDFALARLTDTAWMDDRTTPSAHVRRNLEGLARVFPAGHLLSYVMPHEDEPMAGAGDMALLVRSRMPGTVGLAVDTGTLGESDAAELAQQLYLARAVRMLRGTDASTVVLVPSGDARGFEVLEQVSPATGTAVLFVYRTGDDAAGVSVPLQGLDADAVYQVRSADRGVLGTYSGESLMTTGLTIGEVQESSAQVIIVAPVPPPAPEP
ncbi:MAG: alpha-galactosidase [Vicinamibacterales bacterium]